MSILVFLETSEGAVKKSSLDAVAYASETAKRMGINVVTGVAIGSVSKEEAAKAGQYGAGKVLLASDEKALSSSEAAAFLMGEAAKKEGAEVIVFSSSSLADPIAAGLSVSLSASVVTNVTELPDTSAGFKVKRSIYTGKAFSEVELLSKTKILVIKKNVFTGTASGSSASVEEFSASIPESYYRVHRKEVKKAEGEVLLPEADIVVSGGRGLKGPENWHLIEDLAKVLGAATACSKPVSDMGWRPHHEHVGQTGIKVSPNLYIAVGISGAIQHLAGVNSSKVIVAINKDPEAPFFKAADYGIVGDVFEVLPKLTEAFKAAK